MGARSRSALVSWAVYAAICAAGGLATTFAVAWTIAYLGTLPREQTSQGKELTEEWVWMWFERESFGASMTNWMRSPRSSIPKGPNIVIPEIRDAPATQRPPAGLPDTALWMSVEFGWPMRALGYSRQDTQPQTRWRATNAVLVRRFDRTEQRYLPLLPLWRGLAMNTLLYAAVWLGLLLMPRIARRWWRVRHGCCRVCGYDLRGGFATGCPECGWKRE